MVALASSYAGRARAAPSTLPVEIECPPAPETPPIAGDAAAYGAYHFYRGVSAHCNLRDDEALAEFEAALAYLPASPDILYSIAGSHNALGDYEDALTWYQRYLQTGDEQYRAVAETRVRQLAVLPAHVVIFTEPHDDPDDTAITVTPAAGGAPQPARRGEKVALAAGDYLVHVERPGFKPHDERIHLAIGEQKSFSWGLERRVGTVLVDLPEGAETETLTIDNYLATPVTTQAVGAHHLHVKAAGYYPRDVNFTVANDRAPTVLHVLLKPLPVSGKLELVAGSAVGGAAAGWMTVRSLGSDAAPVSQQAQLIGAGVGLGIGGLGAIYGARRGINLGSAEFVLGDAGVGAAEGAALADTLELDSRERFRFTAAGLAAGYATGLLIAGSYHPSAGKALLFDSIAAWGIGAGALIDNSIESSAHPNRGPLVLAGTNVGLLAGALIAPRVDWSWEQVGLVDLGAGIGLGVGALTAQLAVDLRIAPRNESPAVQAQHRSQFELGGAALGLAATLWIFHDYDQTARPEEPLASAEHGRRVAARSHAVELLPPAPWLAPISVPGRSGGAAPGMAYGALLGGRF